MESLQHFSYLNISLPSCDVKNQTKRIAYVGIFLKKKNFYMHACVHLVLSRAWNYICNCQYAWHACNLLRCVNFLIYFYFLSFPFSANGMHLYSTKTCD